MSAPAPAKADSSTTQKQQERVSIAELKNGKVLFKQKPISFEKQSETLQELVMFRSMLEDRINKQDPPLSVFPPEHKPLIAKLAHESDKTLLSLAKNIHEQLIPTVDEDEDKDVAAATSAALPLNLLENVIEEILARNNYGIEASGAKLPATLCVWRWEVKKEHMNWLPKNSREKAELRLAERIQAREDLKATFDALSQDDKNAITDPKGRNKTTKDFNKPSAPQPQVSTADTKAADATSAVTPSKKQSKKKADDGENADQTDKQPRPKKAVDPEKAAKEKERQEKKAAQLEKEKKEQEKKEKSKSLMAKFFSSKPAKSPTKVSNVQESPVAGPSKIISDYEKVFKPFVLQKDKTLAPVNFFLAEKKRKRRASRQSQSKDIIVIDSDDEMDVDEPPLTSEGQLVGLSAPDHLRRILSSMPPSVCRPKSRQQIEREREFQIYHPISVRDLMSQLTEAEISGNDDLVRSVLGKLRDRDLLPAKAFSFHDDERPGYYGTWTRSSRIIGPRRPLAKDTLVFDYSYDSGEEWEEEPAGEDVAEDAEDDDGDADEQDSDLESWLVDDDDEPDMAALADSSPPPLFEDGFALPPPPPKRKAEDAEKKIGKKRKVVVPLVPFAKGPILENTIGQCDYEPFRPYAIQRLNDTPFSIDPFSYVSTCLEDHKAHLRAANSLSANATVTATKANDPVFAVPALPPRLSNINNIMVTDGASSPNATPSPSNISKKPSAALKSVFPDVHLQLLLTKIMQLQASSINSLVEAIYLDLREHKVKKVSIEAKVREVSEKSKDKKYWVVKPGLLQGDSLQAP